MSLQARTVGYQGSLFGRPRGRRSFRRSRHLRSQMKRLSKGRGSWFR